jgi:hypothetical protein
MNQQELRDMVAAVRAGRVSRRAFVRRMIGLGLTAPFASHLLAHAGLAQAPTPAGYKPTKAGVGCHPRFSISGISAARTGTKLPSGSQAASGS